MSSGQGDAKLFARVSPNVPCVVCLFWGTRLRCLDNQVCRPKVTWWSLCTNFRHLNFHPSTTLRSPGALSATLIATSSRKLFDVPLQGFVTMGLLNFVKRIIIKFTRRYEHPQDFDERLRQDDPNRHPKGCDCPQCQLPGGGNIEDHTGLKHKANKRRAKLQSYARR